MRATVSAHRAALVLGALVALATGAGRASPEDAPAAREVLLQAEDEVRLAATFQPGGATRGPGVVLLPMFRGTRQAWEPLLEPLRVRGVGVLALDPRGHGASAALGAPEVVRAVEDRDPAVFAAMHRDAIAAVRWLAKEGGCDPRRIVLVGASAGGSVALDTAARHPQEVSAVACLSPGVKVLGLDALAHVRALAPGQQVMLLAHADEAAAARALAKERPDARLLVYDDERPVEAGRERAWCHGTRMLGRLPLVEQTLASFVVAATGSKTEDVVLDGVVAAQGPQADPWPRATKVSEDDRPGTVYAFRVGRRLLFGGTAPDGYDGLQLEVETGNLEEKPGKASEEVAMLGPPQVVGVDLKTSHVAWSFGGMGSMPRFPGMEQIGPLFGQTTPVLRAVAGASGRTFEGEWLVPPFLGESKHIRLRVTVLSRAPDGPSGGGILTFGLVGVDLPSR